MENVDVAELDVGRMPIDPNDGLPVQVGYCNLTWDRPLPDRLFVLRDGEGTWQLGDTWEERAGEIRPYRAGAAADLYTGEPLLVVYGTQGDNERDELLRAAAEKAAGTAWWRHSVNGRFPVKADTATTDEDMQRFNLVLIGSAREHSIVARMAERLPFKINGKNELIAGGREPVSLDGAGLRLAYYNPLAPQRLIFLIATDERGEAAEAWLRNVNHEQHMTGCGGEDRGDQPDLVVETLGVPGGHGRGGVPRRLMQFTHNWEWRRGEGADRRLPEDMAPERQIALARLRVMRRSTGADFAFSWGVKPENREFDARWFTLADMATVGTPGRTLLCSMTGEELGEIHEGWTSNGELLAEPAYAVDDLDPQRTYRIVMSPWLCGHITGRWKKNLRDVEAGPDWRQEDLWEEVFE
jgi:hypothetical protein